MSQALQSGDNENRKAWITPESYMLHATGAKQKIKSTFSTDLS